MNQTKKAEQRKPKWNNIQAKLNITPKRIET